MNAWKEVISSSAMLSCLSTRTVKVDEDGFAPVCLLTDIPKRSGLRVKVNGKTLAVFRAGETKLYVLKDACPHQGVSLATSDIEDINGSPCITCPGHYYHFDLRTGKCTDNPQYVQRRYKVQVRDDTVYVRL